jgi:hypothetical protein
MKTAQSSFGTTCPYQYELPCRIIGIHGHAGSGKTTAALHLMESKQSTYIEAFADSLKDACAALFGLDSEFFYDEAAKEQLIEFWGITPRMMAQFVGTELVRQHMWELIPGADNTFWIKRLEGKLLGVLEDADYTNEDVVVIPDVRFQNEYDWVIANGGIVLHLTRDGADGNIGISNHKSEQPINLHTLEKTFLIQNDSSIEALFEAIDSICFSSGFYELDSEYIPPVL